MNWGDFFAMGGYGAYVWSAYGITAVVLALNVIVTQHHHKSTMAMLRQTTPSATGNQHETQT